MTDHFEFQDERNRRKSTIFASPHWLRIGKILMWNIKFRCVEKEQLTNISIKELLINMNILKYVRGLNCQS